MGTKVYSKSYLPVYNSMRDLNEDANSGSWSAFYEDSMLKNGQCYNGFTPSLMDGYSCYDKEVLKQTMLHHEAIFRKQVLELHRLYRVQRNLMTELRKEEYAKLSSKTNPFSSHAPSEGGRILMQMAALPIMNSECGGPSVSASNNLCSVNFLKGMNMPVGSTLPRDCEILDPKVKISPKKSFDLQLPADEYIDSDDREGYGEENTHPLSSGSACTMNIYDGGKPGKDIKPALGMRDRRNVGFHLQESTHCLADLNEPVQEIINEEAEDSASVELLGTSAHCEKRQRKQAPVILAPSRDYFHITNAGRAKGNVLNLLDSETDGSKPGWLSSICEHGLSSGTTKSSFASVFCQEKARPSLEPIHTSSNKACSIPPLLSDQTKREACCKENSGANCSWPPTNALHSSLNSISHSNDLNASSSSISSWRKMTNNVSHVPGAVQTLSSFSRSVSLDVHSKSSNLCIQATNFATEKWDLNSCSRSKTTFRDNVLFPNCSNERAPLDSFVDINKPHPDNGVNWAYEHIDGCGSTKSFRGLDCRDVKSAKDINLNLCLPNGFNTGVNAKDPLFDCEGKQKVLMCPSWLKAKPGTQQSRSKLQDEMGSSPGFVHKFISDRQSKADSQRIESANSLSVRKILGLPLTDVPQTSKDSSNISLCSSPLKEPSEPIAVMGAQKSESSHSDLLCAVHVRPKLEPTGSPSIIRCNINLNSTATVCEDQSNPFDGSGKFDLEVPVRSSGPRSAVNVTHIDLEVPLVEDASSWEEECIRTNQLVTPVEAGKAEETLSRTAAEAIVAISSAVCSNSENGTCYPSPVALSDSILWFAEVVSSKATELESKTDQSKGKKDTDQNSSDEGSDYFEAMTLKLTETDVREYCNKTWERENQKVEERVPTTLLTRPRKGSRRGRQRRDFQRDILPGLVSLSRHEVTEDLQTIGGLMRASGSSWPMGIARRNARNGWNCSSRGRRRQRGCGVVVPPPPPKQHTNNDVEQEGISLQGWGVTTRRPRRQRYPSGNLAALLT